VRVRQAQSLHLRPVLLVMVYSRDDGASPEVVEQRELVDLAYELRLSSSSAYADYQRELMILDTMTGGRG